MPPGATNTEAAQSEDMSDKEIITVFEIKYNTEFHRWEVYRENGVLRNGELQPSFVSALWQDCMNYTAACERRERA